MRSASDRVPVSLPLTLWPVSSACSAGRSVIVDANELNTHPDFQHVIDSARNDDGRFKAVKRVVSLDSSAARLLQLADIVAHSRAWIDHKEINAETLRNAYCIERHFDEKAAPHRTAFPVISRRLETGPTRSGPGHRNSQPAHGLMGRNPCIFLSSIDIKS
ncbi:MAG: hypothetical protein OXE84_09530 [Rhodobacteraceae bacterium]|nr:hypothetical protein [Paracoccaceae bacterium]